MVIEKKQQNITIIENKTTRTGINKIKTK